MGDLVLILAENWAIGYSVLTSLVVIGYITFGVWLVMRCRKYKYDIGVSAMIPLVNLGVFFKSIKYKKAFKQSSIITENILEEEFEL